MDALTRDLERRTEADPADGAAAARLARALARAGRLDEARSTVARRIAAGEVDADTLDLVLELGRGSLHGELLGTPRANVGYVLGAARRPQDGLVELASPTIAFAGVPGAGARECVLALRELLGGRVEETRTSRVDDERVIDVRLALARPWVVTRTYAVRSIRIVTLPVAPHAKKQRRLLLRGTSAIAFVVDARSPGPDERLANEVHVSNESAWKALAADFRFVHGFGLDELPVAFVYPDPVEEAWHRWLTVACGLRCVPRAEVTIETTAPEPEPGAPRFARHEDDDRVIRHEGTLEAFALLLAGVAAGVRGVVATRPRFAR